MSGPTVWLVGGLAAAIGIFLLIWASPRKVGLLDQRLGADPAIPDGLGEGQSMSSVEMARTFRQRALLPAFNNVGRGVAMRLPTKDLKVLRELIDQAGRPSGTTIETVLAKQMISMFLGLLAGLILINVAAFQPPLAMGVPLLTTLVGFTFPRTKLKRDAKKRKKAVIRYLPDMVDLLTVSVEAGLSFEAALRKVVEKFENELSQEFTKALNEYRLGMPLVAALKDMATRLDVLPLQQVVRVVTQSEQLGTSLGSILRIQSEQLRREKRARAAELGQKAPIKMLLPMVGCIFPTIFIVLLGPAVIKIVTGK